MTEETIKSTLARKPKGISEEEWLNPLLAKKSWGSDVIPKSKWIDTTKTYKTRNGKKVENLDIVMENSCGDEVTFPVKGTIVLKESPRRVTFAIWTLDGKSSVLPDSAHHNNPSERDLVKVGK